MHVPAGWGPVVGWAPIATPDPLLTHLENCRSAPARNLGETPQPQLLPLWREMKHVGALLRQVTLCPESNFLRPTQGWPWALLFSASWRRPWGRPGGQLSLPCCHFQQQVARPAPASLLESVLWGCCPLLLQSARGGGLAASHSCSGSFPGNHLIFKTQFPVGAACHSA